MILNNVKSQMCHVTKRGVSFVKSVKSMVCLNWNFAGFIFIYELDLEPLKGVNLHQAKRIAFELKTIDSITNNFQTEESNKKGPHSVRSNQFKSNIYSIQFNLKNKL